MLSVLAVCIGMAFILGLRFDQIDPVGVGLAVQTMVSAIVITVVNARIAQVTGSPVSSFYMTLWGAVIFGAVLIAIGDFREPRASVGWISRAGNGFAYCVAWVAFKKTGHPGHCAHPCE